ncbi:type VI secretion system protein IglI family protein [Francisella sp. TX07-6608]|uniref:type VI secretion system protein IglI family protein n=1 Tax=Francisella sp. TX07-6608 TaxID=573568 RepID=UPI0008F9B502|nr:type VI secretion system protein IglI family protein [Francisella sp. TX07-6608]OIN84958.1 hypothetical protein KX00_2263 [Francisella sp. TX07-6608]
MLDFLENINIQPIDRIDTVLVLKITALFENGDYENTAKLIEKEFTENEYIDVTFLYYLIVSQLNLDKKLKNFIISLDLLNNLYQKKGNLFSPKKYINNHITKSFNNLSKFYIQNLLAFNKENISFDILTEFEQKLNKLKHTIESCFDTNLSKQDSFIQLCRKITDLKKNIKQKIVNYNDDKKEIIKDNKPSSENIIEKVNIQKENTKWQSLLRKVEDLKFAIENDDIIQISIVYNNLEYELSKFNPKDYFPEIFYDMYLSLTPIMSKILKFTKKNFESIDWYLANNLYNLNPDKFLEHKINFSSPTEYDNLDFISKNHKKTNNTLIGGYFDYIQNKNNIYKTINNSNREDADTGNNESSYNNYYDDNT